MSDIIDINVNPIFENVEIDVQPNVTIVNINEITGGGGGVPEAPIDGELYGRKDAAWEVVPTGGSFDPTTAPIGTITPNNAPIETGISVNQAFSNAQGQIDAVKIQPKDADFTAEFNGFYTPIVSVGGTITITDPTPTVGDRQKGFFVFIPPSFSPGAEDLSNVVIGGATYKTGFKGKLIYRFYAKYIDTPDYIFRTTVITDVDGGQFGQQSRDLIQIRRNTSTNWTSTNPTLASGEFGYETNTGKLKIGDDVTAWNSLAYFGTTPDLQSVLAQGNEAIFQDDSLSALSISYESEDSNNQTIFSQEPSSISINGIDNTNTLESKISIINGEAKIQKSDFSSAGQITQVTLDTPTHNTNWKVPARGADGDYVFAGLDDVKTTIDSYTENLIGTSIINTTAEGITYSQLIPANTFQEGDGFYVRFRIFSVNAVAKILRIKLNTTNSLSGAIDLGTFNGSATTRVSEIERWFNITSTNTRYIVPTTNFGTDFNAVTSNNFGGSTIDWTVDQYFLFTIQASASTETQYGLGYKIEHYKK